MSAQSLLPLAPVGNLQNLFLVLDPVAPELRGLIAEISVLEGTVCQEHRVPRPTIVRRDVIPQVISVRLVRLDLPDTSDVAA